MTILKKDAIPAPATRQNLVEFFSEFSNSQIEFIQHDDGYRTWTYTYKQISLASYRFAERLSENNILKDNKVIIWSENCPEWVAAFWGCVLAGAIVVPIDYRSSPSILRHVCEIVDARVIMIGEEVHFASWEQEPIVWRLSELEWSTKHCELPKVQIDQDDVVEIVFTSGSTGEPKGVLITHRNILSNLISPSEIISKYRKWFRPVLPLRFLSLIPLSHMFGQALILFIFPIIPCTAVFMHGYSPREITRQIRARRVSVLVTVPKILEMLQKQIMRQFPETAESSLVEEHWICRWWRYRRVHWSLGWRFWAFVVGAAPLPTELEEFWTHLGLPVIQGYGLTETAPIVAFSNPFDIETGTAGKPVAGVEIKIASDGEILVRGQSLTSGYYQAPAETAAAFKDGWFHTGDIGNLSRAGNLTIRGRKKEMIATPEGLKVFPEDVEDVLNRIPGVRESAVVGRDQVYAVLVLHEGANPDEIVRQANLRLENHQRIRSVSVWPGERLPRTEGTKKLKHGEIQAWVDTGQFAPTTVTGGGTVIDLLKKYAPNRTITPDTTLDQLGLSSLDRVELMLDLEEQFDTSVDESLFTGANTVSTLDEFSPQPRRAEFPSWNRLWFARIIRRAALSLLFLPFVRVFARVRISGRENLTSLRGPVIFAPNHQSHLDAPLILSALPPRFRYRVAPAMWKEYFDGHFSPSRHTRYERFRDTLLYWLVALFFNAFPLPQTETGARQSLRYLGDMISDNWSVLFFPEGERTEAGEIKIFQPGIGLIAARLGVPVVPIRLKGLEKVLHRHQRWPHPGHVELAFGAPILLKGQDYTAAAKEVEEAVRAL